MVKAGSSGEDISFLVEKETIQSIKQVALDAGLDIRRHVKYTNSLESILKGEARVSSYDQYLVQDIDIPFDQAQYIAAMTAKLIFAKRPELFSGSEKLLERCREGAKRFLSQKKSERKAEESQPKVPPSFPPKQDIEKASSKSVSDIKPGEKKPVPPKVPVRPKAPKPAFAKASADRPVPVKVEKPVKSTSPILPDKKQPKVPLKPKELTTLRLKTLDDLSKLSPRALDYEGQDETKMIGRLKQEIQNIANTSGAKRAEIIETWKQSNLYHTYVDMGNDSMQKNKGIMEVSAFRKTEGKPYLTEPQFHAVSEISRLLLR
jgi:hypothetical protein